MSKYIKHKGDGSFQEVQPLTQSAGVVDAAKMVQLDASGRFDESLLLGVFNGLSGVVTASTAELNTMDGITATTSELNTMDGITATTAELNRTASTAGNGAIDAFDSGVTMSFSQAAAPTGWTQDTTNTDAMLRVVSGAGGGVGGTDSAILNDKIPTHNHSASSNSTGAHTHSMQAYSYQDLGTIRAVIYDTDSNSILKYTASAGAHAHTITVNNNTGSNWTPKYVDMIICVKD